MTRSWTKMITSKTPKILRVVQTQAIFLKSMSKVVGSDMERLRNLISRSTQNRLKMASFKFRVVLCRIRLFPTLISKRKCLGSELPLQIPNRANSTNNNCPEFGELCLECETVHRVHFIFWLGSVKRILFHRLSILQAAACLIHNFDLDYDELQRIRAFFNQFFKIIILGNV